eukprot:TRINITY_DN4052_c0_g1_i1.p2 TRINITY_DN4052_c0_g1~~TRINITY_DN4052_c0_g1_i1.p2  ORF type:complete len:462 (-),score=127.49 TRINITY_DN4052_c0_g1_i1:375-1574(-)
MTVELVPVDTQASLLVGTHMLCRTISSEAAVAAAADAYATVGPVDSDFLWLGAVTAYQWNVPLVSSMATALALNSVDDSELWPVNGTSASGEPTSYLFHTVPRDDLRVTAVLELVARMKRKRDAARARRPWSVYGSERVGVLYSEDQFGQSGMYSLFRRLSVAHAASPSGGRDGSALPVRLVRMLSFPSDGDAALALRDLADADVRIIIVWSALLVPGAAARLFGQADALGMVGEGYQWIVTAAGEALFGPASGFTAALARKAVGTLTVEPTVPAGRLTSPPRRRCWRAWPPPGPPGCPQMSTGGSPSTRTRRTPSTRTTRRRRLRARRRWLLPPGVSPSTLTRRALRPTRVIGAPRGRAGRRSTRPSRGWPFRGCRGSSTLVCPTRRGAPRMSCKICS